MEQNKKYYFISGLPRSGSTLLCNILNQNPRFHATSTSGVVTLLLMIRDNWESITDFRATETDMEKFRVMKAVLPSFYNDKKAEVIFDKSRGWPSQYEMIESLIGGTAKTLVCVRDIRDVLSSFEKIWRKESASRLIPQQKQFREQFQTIQGRCDVWMMPGQPVGQAYNSIKDALARGFGDRMHFVFFEKLTRDPETVMRDIYAFLEEPYFDHNFDHIEQTTKEDDRAHGFTDLHTIKEKIQPVESDWRTVLGPFAEKYGALNFWDTALHIKNIKSSALKKVKEQSSRQQ